MTGFSETHLDINGIDTAVFIAGSSDTDAAPLVFFHGAGTSTGFDSLLPVAAERQVIVAHHPGFGESGDPVLTSAADLARHQLDVLDRLGIGRFALAGQSMGGWIAATLATFSTDRITKLVLACPAGLDSTAHPMTDLSSIPPEEVPSYLTADLSVFGLDGPPSPEYQAARAREAESAGAIFAVDPPFSPNLRRWLHRVTVPTLLMWGDADRLIPVGQAPEWAALLPMAIVKTFDGAGHLLFDERAEAAAVLAEFVR